MNRLISLVLLLLVATILTACSLAAPAPVSTAPVNRPTQAANQESLQLPTRRPNAADGAELYAQKCSACHGDQGRGDGARAAQIQTQNGSPVADLTADTIARARTPEQWYAIVTNGRLDKLMPPFAGSLTVDQRWDVIVYGWTLSAPPAQIAEGKQVYAAQCVQCHGEKGKGDGPDAKGNLPDFTNFSTIVSAASGKWDQALSTSHLPSFAGTVSVADQRAAIDYVRSFAYDYPTNTTLPTQAAPSAAAAGSVVTSTTSLTGTPPVPGTIDGYIVNGTAGAATPGNLPITFYVFPGGTGNTVVTQTLQSDAQGRFVVDNVQASHGDLVAAGTTYKDLQFHSGLVPYAAQISLTLPITVYESTTDASKIQIDTLHIVVMPDANGLQVSEIYVLSNSGDRWVAGMGQPIMHLGLPAGAQNFSSDPNSMQPNTLVPNGDGLDYYDVVPVGAGSTQIIFQYSLPKTAVALDRPLFQKVSVVNLLLGGDSAQVSVSSPQLTEAGPQSIQGQTYQLYQGANLAPGQTLSINIGSAAGASPSWPVIAGIVLVVIGVVGLALWLRSRRKLAGATLDPGDEREALLDQIAALDDNFEAGQIDKIDYNAKRARLKAKLLKLMSNE